MAGDDPTRQRLGASDAADGIANHVFPCDQCDVEAPYLCAFQSGWRADHANCLYNWYSMGRFRAGPCLADRRTITASCDTLADATRRWRNVARFGHGDDPGCGCDICDGASRLYCVSADGERPAPLAVADISEPWRVGLRGGAQAILASFG